MTDFRLAYKTIHDSVVGLGWTREYEIAICGTGVVLHSNARQALVLTNEHVVKALSNPRPDGARNCAVTFHDKMNSDANGEAVPSTEVVRHSIPYFGVQVEQDSKPPAPIPGLDTVISGPYQRPDLGLVVVDCKRPLRAASHELDQCPEEGLPVGLLGFPGGLRISPETTGEDLQCTPILQTGVLSAVLPNRIAPHKTLVANIYSDRGSSGSPLFDSTGKVLGVVFAGRDQSDGSMSSQLLAVPLTELQEGTRAALKSGEIATLYEWLSEQRKKPIR